MGVSDPADGVQVTADGGLGPGRSKEMLVIVPVSEAAWKLD